MMTIKRVLEEETCILCGKEKEVASVVLNGQSSGEIQLCWSDVRKMAQMQMRMHGDVVGGNRTAPPAATVLDDNESDD